MDSTSNKFSAKTWTGISWPTHKRKAAQRRAAKRKLAKAGK